MINGRYYPLWGTLISCLRFYCADLEWYEIILCAAIVSTVLVVYDRKRGRKIQTISTCVIIGYFTILICFTLLGRSNVHFDYNLELLFSTYIKLLRGVRYVEYDIIYNILLFIPFGYLLGQYRFNKALCILCLSTLSIEIIQISFSVGLFEICDLVDNTLGGVMGYGLSIIVRRLKNEKMK